MAGTSGFPGKPVLVFDTTDAFGNSVVLHDSTLTSHIIARHGDMVGFESAIRPALEDPDFVYASTATNTAAVFELLKRGEGNRDLRVLVGYTTAAFTDGTCTGTVATAYARDVVRYPEPNVGKVIYKKR